jgi:hypothetical protein
MAAPVHYFFGQDYPGVFSAGQAHIEGRGLRVAFLGAGWNFGPL